MSRRRRHLPPAAAAAAAGPLGGLTRLDSLRSEPFPPAGSAGPLDDAALQAFMRAHSQGHAEMLRRARMAQRETLTPPVQREFGLDRASAQPQGIRRNSSAPSLSRDDDGLPKVVIGICGALAGEACFCCTGGCGHCSCSQGHLILLTLGGALTVPSGAPPSLCFLASTFLRFAPAPTQPRPSR